MKLQKEDVVIKDLFNQAKEMKKPKRKVRTFTKKDMLDAFNSGRSRRFDTGVLYYNNFETWYKDYKIINK